MPRRGIGAILLIAAAFASACSGSSDSTTSKEADGESGNAGVSDAAVPNERSLSAEAKRVAKRCHWERHARVKEHVIRSAFVDGRGGDVHLLLQDDVVHPGALFVVSVASDSANDVRYGTFSHIEHAATGKRIRIEGPYGFRAIGFALPPGEVGPCVTLPVPSRTPPGKYRAVLDDVSGKSIAGESLQAEFVVRGPAIERPRWEVRLKRAQRHNRGGR